MPPRANNEPLILDVAEAMIRARGYNGVSFREIAEVVGVKSSSVHYYFPTKAALGAAVAARYTERFLEALGPVEDAPADANDVLARLRDLTRGALVEDKLMCLCGVLGAEVADLPPEVVEETRSFFEGLEAWLVRALSRTMWGRVRAKAELRQTALKAIALVEGALMLARAMDRPELYDEIELDRLD